MLLDLAKAINITTFRVWKNNFGKVGIKEGRNQREGIKEWGDYLKRGDKYPLWTMVNDLKVFLK